jgi:hypothetical protein
MTPPPSYDEGTSPAKLERKRLVSSVELRQVDQGRRDERQDREADAEDAQAT